MMEEFRKGKERQSFDAFFKREKKGKTTRVETNVESGSEAEREEKKKKE